MSNDARLPIYSLGPKARAEVADRALEFYFDKPVAMSFEVGRFMDLMLLDRYLGDIRCPDSALPAPFYDVTGPAPMAARRAMFNERSIDDDDIRTEEFTGY